MKKTSLFLFVVIFFQYAVGQNIPPQNQEFHSYLMKKTSLFLLVVIFFQYTVGQNVPLQNQEFHSYLMKKSKNQKITAQILLLGGGVTAIAGAAVGMSNAAPDGSEEAMGTAGAFFAIGITSMLASVPFYISSAAKRQKARQLEAGISFERIDRYQVYTKYPAYYPALSLKIKLR